MTLADRNHRDSHRIALWASATFLLLLVGALFAQTTSSADHAAQSPKTLQVSSAATADCPETPATL